MPDVTGSAVPADTAPVSVSVSAKERAEEVLAILRDNTALRPFTSNHDRSVLAYDVLALVAEVARLSAQLSATTEERDALAESNEALKQHRATIQGVVNRAELAERDALASKAQLAEAEKALRRIVDVQATAAEATSDGR